MAFRKLRTRYKNARSNYGSAGRQGGRGSRRRARRRAVTGFLGLPDKVNVGGAKVPLLALAGVAAYFFIAPFKSMVNGLFKK